MALNFTALSEVQCELGESPVYDDRRAALWYCDIVGKAIHRADIATGATRSRTFATEVGSLGLCESGRLIVALRDEVGFFDPEDESFRPLVAIERDNPETRLNDGKVGPDGAFWVGTMDDSSRPVKQPIGSLYRVSRDGRAEQKVTGLQVSNGLAWSPDGRIMYHSDSRGPSVDRWDFDPATGAIANRTRFADLTDDIGRPDGGATDADGCYWSAGVSAARLNRFSPEGKLIEHHLVPVAAPTMPCFGGPDLKRLFVTSLRVGRSAALLDNFPLTGIVIAAPSPVAGCPVTRFRD